MATKFDLIYELRSDEKRVRQIQEETVQDDGLSTAPYLFGSEEWWAAVEADSIKRRTVEGTITEAPPTSMSDPQQFRMRMTDGAELTGVRHGDPTRYVEGLRVWLEYVTVQRSADAPSELATADVVIAVWIEHSHKRTPYLHSVLLPYPWPIDFDR
jgi:hypothetical protein